MFGWLRNIGPRATGPSGPPGARAYAVGDVHGRLDLLDAMLARIAADLDERPVGKAFLVFLGDLIDRGPDSRGVIERLQGLSMPPTRNIFIAGNHEEFLLEVLDSNADLVGNWLNYGGLECAASYGLSEGWLLNAAPQTVCIEMARRVPASHQAFLRAMGDSFRFGDYLFVHAGVRPGVALEDQRPKDLRWIREEFLNDRTDHGAVVVHGHTIVEAPQERANRIGIDTGAYRTGVLTAIVIEGAGRRYLATG